jgi:hypothetical protein
MVDFVSTHARVKGVAPSANGEGNQAEAIASEPLSASPPPTADGVDKLYHQLTEIHTIAAMQLAMCAHGAGPTQLLAWFRPGQVGRGLPQCPRGKVGTSNPRLTRWGCSLHYDEHSSRRRWCRDHKGPGKLASGSDMHDV